MKKWTEKDIPSQAGKKVIVTGANSGIGYETAVALAQKEATVILACRTLAKAEEAKSKILQTSPSAKLEPMELDLASLASVKRFAQKFQEQFDQLDLLINNAGIMMPPYQVTEDGFENQLATNYIGHFALTGLLLPLLTQTPASRVVSLSSLAHRWANIQFDDLHFEKGYNKQKAYGQSKRACLMFAYELQRRLTEAGHDTLSLAAHPGVSKTNLDRYFPAIIRPLGTLFLQNQRKGALPTLFAATAKELKGGEYIGPDGVKEMRGYPKIVDSDEGSKDKKMAERLWKVSEEMTDVFYLD
jgi:NAD(P)-dependent dehydrogenase (short-subunit alcohol dehydrogenase family)